MSVPDRSETTPHVSAQRPSSSDPQNAASHAFSPARSAAQTSHPRPAPAEEALSLIHISAFAAAVKIDTFAYLPVQDFGNAYSTFIAQNYGARNQERIRKGTRQAFLLSATFSIVISAIVCLFAAPLMQIFVSAAETAVIACGVRYLHIEGAFYCGIGCLFLLYGYCLLYTSRCV